MMSSTSLGLVRRLAVPAACCSLRAARHLLPAAGHPCLPAGRSVSCCGVLQRRPIRVRAPAAPVAAVGAPQQCDVDALVSRLYRLLSAEERVLLVSEGAAAAALAPLPPLGFTEQQLSESLLAAPQLLQRGPAGWVVAPLLLQHGCAPQQVLTMLAECPRLLDVGGERLTAALTALRSRLATPDAELLQLLGRWPQLLLQPAARLGRQLSELETAFTEDQVTRIALRCPTVLEERWEDTSRKIDYFMETMGLTTLEIAHSSGMSFPLHHVRARHTVLERTGSYRRPPPKQLGPSGNPSLTEIVDQTDEVFCQRVARLPQREYEVFVRLLQEEMEAESSEDSGDSDEEDEQEARHSYSNPWRRSRS